MSCTPRRVPGPCRTHRQGQLGPWGLQPRAPAAAPARGRLVPALPTAGAACAGARPLCSPRVQTGRKGLCRGPGAASGAPPQRRVGFGVLCAARPPLPHRSPYPRGSAGRRRCAGTPAPQPPPPPREAPTPSPTCVLCLGSRGGCGRVPGAGGAHPMERRGARCPARCGGGRGAGTASTPRILRSVGLATSSGRRVLGGAGAGLVLSPPPGRRVPEPPRASAGRGMGHAAPGTPRLPPHRGCPWDPQPPARRRAAAMGGSPEPPPLSPGEQSGLRHCAGSQEGTATGLTSHRAPAAAHSKGQAGNEPRPRGGLRPLQCHGHAVVTLSLLSAQAGPSRLVREKNISFSPRKALPFHRAPGSCPGNHRPHCGAGSPALLATSCWEQRAGLGGSAW